MAVAQIASTQSVALATAPGQRLRADAAAAWDAAVRAFGSTVLLTDSLRPYDVQERIFRDRYRLGNHAGKAGFTRDVRYWNGQPWTRRAGTAAAAVPGTSNHGGGVAVDVRTSRRATDPAKPAAVVFTGFSDPDRTAFLAVARAYGWADDEGRSVGEPWHLTYYPSRDTHPAPPAPAPTPTPSPAPTPAPAPDAQEDDDMPANAGFYYDRDAKTRVYLIVNTSSGWYHEFGNGTGKGPMPSTYVNALAKALGTPTWAQITPGHAAVIKAGLAAVLPKTPPADLTVTIDGAE